jgi:hypothetical protein
MEFDKVPSTESTSVINDDKIDYGFATFLGMFSAEPFSSFGHASDFGFGFERNALNEIYKVGFSFDRRQT